MIFLVSSEEMLYNSPQLEEFRRKINFLKHYLTKQTCVLMSFVWDIQQINFYEFVRNKCTICSQITADFAFWVWNFLLFMRVIDTLLTDQQLSSKTQVRAQYCPTLALRTKKNSLLISISTSIFKNPEAPGSINSAFTIERPRNVVSKQHPTKCPLHAFNDYYNNVNVTNPRAVLIHDFVNVQEIYSNTF